MKYLDDETYETAAPLVTGAALIALGVALIRADPGVLRLPEDKPMPDKPLERIKEGEAGMVVAETLRAGATSLVPANLVERLGKIVLLAGVGMVVVKFLDWIVGGNSWIKK